MPILEKFIGNSSVFLSQSQKLSEAGTASELQEATQGTRLFWKDLSGEETVNSKVSNGDSVCYCHLQFSVRAKRLEKDWLVRALETLSKKPQYFAMMLPLPTFQDGSGKIQTRTPDELARAS